MAQAEAEITKINIECRKCQEKLKKFLSKFQGVYSVKFDPESGKLTVTTPVDRQMFSEAVGHARFSAELRCEDSLPPQHISKAVTINGGVQDGPEVIKWAQMADLQKLPNFHRVKKLELTEHTQSGNSRRIKLKFHDHNKDMGLDEQNGPTNKNACADHQQQGGEGSSTTSNSNTSGTGATSNSDGGGIHDHNFEFQYVHAPDGEPLPIPAAGNNSAPHTYFPPTIRDRITVEHATLRCEDAIASRCTIL